MWVDVYDDNLYNLFNKFQSDIEKKYDPNTGEFLYKYDPTTGKEIRL